MDPADSSASANRSNAVVSVRCGGIPGDVHLESNGDVVWKPSFEAKSQPWWWNCLPSLAPQRQIIACQDIVGACTTDQGNTLQIWYCQPVRTRHGDVVKVKYQLRKSSRFECGSRQEAAELAGRIQQAACWWGRSKPQHLVLVVNPASGQGRSSKLLDETLLPILRDAAGLRVTVHKTRSRGHATRIIQSMDFSDVDLMVYVGGDGTVYEGVQGILGRPDWSKVCKVPIAHVPSGSGNGLAASTSLWDPITAAYAICKGRTHPLDMASVPEGCRRHLLFLSIVFGSMANLDVGTENLRWMGEARFTVGGIREVLSNRMYPIKVAYWPDNVPMPQQAPRTAASLTRAGSESLADAAAPGIGRVSSSGPPAASTADVAAASTTQSSNSSAGSNGVLRSGHEASTSASQGGAGFPPSPRLRRNGGDSRKGGDAGAAAGAAAASDSLLSPGATSSCAPLARSSDPGSSGQRQDGGLGRQGTGTLGTSGTTVVSDLWRLDRLAEGPPLPILSQFRGQLPSRIPASVSDLPPGWQLLPEQDLQMFGMYNPQYLALHTRFNRKGRLNNGSWDLIFTHGLEGVWGRVKAANMLLAADDGSHVDLEYVTHERVRAIMLEPLCTNTSLVLDGELVPIQPLLMEVHPGLCNVLVAPEFKE